MTSPAVIAGSRPRVTWLRRRSTWLAFAVAIVSIGASAVHLFRSDTAIHAPASTIKVTTRGAAAASSTPAVPRSRRAPAGGLPGVPFEATLDGTITQSPPDSTGRIRINLLMRTAGVDPAQLSVVLIGRPVDGGVALASSSVEFGPVSDSASYRGQVIALDDEQFVAHVSGLRRSLDLDVVLHIDPASGSVGGPWMPLQPAKRGAPTRRVAGEFSQT